jgi:hypothetical protein
MRLHLAAWVRAGAAHATFALDTALASKSTAATRTDGLLWPSAWDREQLALAPTVVRRIERRTPGAQTNTALAALRALLQKVPTSR